MSVLEALRDAEKSQQLVQVGRHRLEARGIFSYGFVSGVSETLVAIHKLSSQLDLDGYEVLRVKDITAITTSFKTRHCYEIALELKSSLPQPLPAGIDLTSVASVICSASACYPVLVLEQERLRKGEAVIGQVRKTYQTGVKLRVLTPDAHWEEDRLLYQFVSITRLEFDGEYENTLALVSKRFAFLDTGVS